MAGKNGRPVLVTHATLPPLDAYMACVRDIFDSQWLTNQGRYCQTLERELASFLEVPGLALCSNGTLALQLALRLLGLNGKKVITTPFTYVATLSSLLWEGCEPVFADIDPQSLCISPREVERCIGEHPDAAGILPVHVYGNACDVDALADIAELHNIRLFYDAAHAFGSKLRGKSLFAYGDAATGSFHATKLFHTAEGGCIAVPNAEMAEKLRLLHAFGHRGDDHICLGINAKMSELHAAMGVCLLPGVTDILKLRAYAASIYDAALRINNNDRLRRPELAPGLEWNHGYYPVILPDNAALLRAESALSEQAIYPRRYFFPSLNTLPYVKYRSCPVSEDMASRVLCLPFWPGMESELIEKISYILLEAIG